MASLKKKKEKKKSARGSLFQRASACEVSRSLACACRASTRSMKAQVSHCRGRSAVCAVCDRSNGHAQPRGVSSLRIRHSRPFSSSTLAPAPAAPASRTPLPPPSPPLTLSQIQQTVARVTEVCWDKCVGYPGRALSSRESSCMADCAKRFVETTQFIVQRFQAKAGAEGGGGGGSGLFE